jgi:peptide/nickel transport system permease protein
MRMGRLLRRLGLSGNPLLLIGAFLIVLETAAAIFAPWIAGVGPEAQDILARLQGPSPDHWLGTDNFGRDVLARILWSYRTLFGISLLAVIGALLAGGTAGVVAAWRGGWLDRVIMRVMDVLFAFPIILLAIGIIAVLGPGSLSTAIAIGVVYVPIFARVLRGPALLLRETEYVAAARSIGATERRILLRHLLPNLAPVILVQASLSLSTAILVEASLAFLGLGTQPPTPSLGRMLSESRDFLALSPWPAVFSGAAILLASLAFNLFGDGLQDRLDPRLRSR